MCIRVSMTYLSGDYMSLHTLHEQAINCVRGLHRTPAFSLINSMQNAICQLNCQRLREATRSMCPDVDQVENSYHSRHH